MRFRHIAGGLAGVAVAMCGVPAAASAATWDGAPAAASAATITPAARPLPAGVTWHGVPAAGSNAAAGKIPWKRYRTKPWHDAPGKVCAFGVNVTIVRDREQYRTLSSYPGGKPRVQEFRGPLYVRYTNTSTGKSMVGNLSGYGWFYYPAGGGVDIYVPDHIGLTVHAGTKGFPAGEWIVSGRALVIVSSSGANHVVPIHATIENVCRMLS